MGLLFQIVQVCLQMGWTTRIEKRSNEYCFFHGFLNLDPCFPNGKALCGGNTTCVPDYVHWNASCTCKYGYGPAFPVCNGFILSFFLIRFSFYLSLQNVDLCQISTTKKACPAAHGFCIPDFANWNVTCVCEEGYGPAYPNCSGLFFFPFASFALWACKWDSMILVC